MKNIMVDNLLIENGFEELYKVVDWYRIAGWIVQCLKCGTWLTSLGLCPECGVRYELVEQTKVIDRDSFCRIQKHVYIEGVCAECGHKESQAVEQTLAHGQGLEFCPGHAAPVVNGYCFDCGLPHRPAGKA